MLPRYDFCNLILDNFNNDFLRSLSKSTKSISSAVNIAFSNNVFIITCDDTACFWYGPGAPSYTRVEEERRHYIRILRVRLLIGCRTSAYRLERIKMKCCDDLATLVLQMTKSDLDGPYPIARLLKRVGLKHNWQTRNPKNVFAYVSDYFRNFLWDKSGMPNITYT